VKGTPHRANRPSASSMRSPASQQGLIEARRCLVTEQGGRGPLPRPQRLCAISWQYACLYVRSLPWFGNAARWPLSMLPLPSHWQSYETCAGGDPAGSLNSA
jgi:hypothetical protein